MDSQDEKRICIVEKATHEMPEDTEHNKFWLSLQVDNDTLVSVVVRLMLSIVVSSSAATIPFILFRSGPGGIGACYFYVGVILLWIAVISLVFFNYMWNGVLRDKPENIKNCFVFGMAVNLLVVCSATIYAFSSYGTEVLLSIMIFIGVFNSMAMLMFHEMKVQMEEEKRQRTYTHKIYEVPKGLQVAEEQEK